MLKRKLIVLVTLLVLCAGFYSINAQDKIDLGVINPGMREISVIAIPTFDPEAGSKTYKDSVFNTVIYNDLELSGYFVKPSNESVVESNKKRDVMNNKIDFAEWKRLNVTFLLEGKYFIDDNTLSADVILYDVLTGQRIFGKKFSNFTPAQQRTLCHKIADEIIYYITHLKGVSNTKILFISDRTGNKEVWVMDADGYNQRQITKDKSIASAPCWGKNATEVYYTSYKEYNPDLCGIFLDGSKRWYVSSYQGLNVSASWSEKTEKITATLSKDGNSEIYTMDRYGKNSKRITFNKSIDSSPTWSPEGNQIVFTSDRGGNPQLYTMNAEGFNVQRLTFQGNYNDGGDWSPKGDKIVFHARYDGEFNIFLIDLPTNDWFQLTSNQGNNEDPQFSPDGQHVVFSSSRSGKYQIYIMHVDGSNQKKLTTDGANISAAWSPYME